MIAKRDLIVDDDEVSNRWPHFWLLLYFFFWVVYKHWTRPKSFLKMCRCVFTTCEPPNLFRKTHVQPVLYTFALVVFLEQTENVPTKQSCRLICPSHLSLNPRVPVVSLAVFLRLPQQTVCWGEGSEVMGASYVCVVLSLVPDRLPRQPGKWSSCLEWGHTACDVGGKEGARHVAFKRPPNTLYPPNLCIVNVHLFIWEIYVYRLVIYSFGRQ